MSSQSIHASSGADSSFLARQVWKIAVTIAVVTVLLALLGVGLTTTNKSIAPTYWMSLVPVYGLLCIATAWVRTRRGEGDIRVVVRQVFHWLGIAAAVGLDFFIRGTGEETGVGAGFNALLLLALGCFLAGVHFESLFLVIGLILTLALVAVVRADQYMWLIVGAGLVVIGAIGGLMWLRIKARRRLSSAGPSAPAGS